MLELTPIKNKIEAAKACWGRGIYLAQLVDGATEIRGRDADLALARVTPGAEPYARLFVSALDDGSALVAEVERMQSALNLIALHARAGAPLEWIGDEARRGLGEPPPVVAPEGE